ncbi:Metacaspase-1 [Rhynchospora pubera]|uniref:Metacaspase-1 n=1 Tax=Rhynchospora pubera TaxID=906938 RepID=A0AAV8CC83_9POAL|nr:Metacaspase-1 [Rhynchospora pubera]
MGSGNRSQTMRCKRCGVTLVVPPSARNICCSICRHTTYVGRDPVRHAVGFVKSMVTNLANSGNSFNSSPYSYGSQAGMQQFGYSNPAVYIPTNYPRVFGKKRALLIGITYTSSRYELKGTINDVNCVAYLLSQKFGFPKECILILTDEDPDPYKTPTKENMRAAMRWLVSGCTAGDSLLFHFSGHGVQKLDTTHDEVDGYDEALCPLDFETNGPILDDEINATIVRPLPFNVKLHALVDACHSGTILDLPYLCRISRSGSWQWEDHGAPSGEYKGTRGGLAILISGCDDNQTSSDTSAFAGSTSTGAMTYSFIQAIECEPGTTYGRLLTSMRAAIRETGSGCQFSGPIASLIRKAIPFGSTQEPQLSSSEMFEIYHKPFLL